MRSFQQFFVSCWSHVYNSMYLCHLLDQQQLFSHLHTRKSNIRHANKTLIFSKSACKFGAADVTLLETPNFFTSGFQPFFLPSQTASHPVRKSGLRVSPATLHPISLANGNEVDHSGLQHPPSTVCSQKGLVRQNEFSAEWPHKTKTSGIVQGRAIFDPVHVVPLFASRLYFNVNTTDSRGKATTAPSKISWGTSVSAICVPRL